MIPKLENHPRKMTSSDGPVLIKTLENEFLTFRDELVYDTVEKIHSMSQSYW